MEYYSAIKRNEIMPSAATWMDLETVILSERQIPYDITYMQNLNYDNNELTYEPETCGCQERVGRDGLGVWD